MSARHSPELVAALTNLVAKLEALPEPLRGPFVIKGLKPYLAPTDNLEAGAGDLVERRVELITNALLHLPIRGAELQFAARQVELALRPEMEKVLEAERQACASIARGHAGVDKASSARFLAHNIASAILARAALSQEAPK